MKALIRYRRLESTGLWRAAPELQRREVIVALGVASVVLKDPLSGEALVHWALPSLRRCNAGEMPAIFAPSSEPESETLEIDDPTMIDALGEVLRELASRRASPWRVRLLLVGTMAASLVALGVLWLPGALVGHTSAAVPFVTRIEIGRQVLTHMAAFTGTQCETRSGRAALDRLSERLSPGAPIRIEVLREGLSGTLHLPGRLVLIDRRLLEDHDSPDLMAAHVALERLRAEAADPLAGLLQEAGSLATFRLLTTGGLPDAALRAHAERVLRAPSTEVASDAILRRFATLAIATTPYALAQGAQTPQARLLIEADPLASGTADAPAIMTDLDWVALQAICR